MPVAAPFFRNELRQEPVSKAYVSHRIQEEEKFLHHLEETYTR